MPTHVVIGRRLKALVVKFRDDKKQAAREATRAIQVARDAQYMADLAQRNRCVPPGGGCHLVVLSNVWVLDDVLILVGDVMVLVGRCTGAGGRCTAGRGSVVLDYALVPSDAVLILLPDDVLVVFYYVLVPSDDVLVLLYDVPVGNVLVLLSDDAPVCTDGKCTGTDARHAGAFVSGYCCTDTVTGVRGIGAAQRCTGTLDRCTGAVVRCSDGRCTGTCVAPVLLWLHGGYIARAPRP